MQILIVDKSIHLLERLEEILVETENISPILKTVSYEKATVLFKKNKPDVVVVDINGSRNEAFKLLKEIKNTGYKTSIIILSDYVDENISEQCRLQGADFFLDKYYEFEKISEIINAIKNK